MSNSLFSGGEDWRANACLNWSLDSMGLYVEGYKEGADRLVSDVIQSGSNQDTLVFPICFLYRQYIELQLKQIIKESRIFLDQGSKFPEHHKIDSLWNTANSLMAQIIKEHDRTIADYISKADIKEIQHVITEFIKVDPDSFSFRYPKDKKGNKNLAGIEYINLRKLSESMQSLKEKLDKYYLCISILRDYQDQMKADYMP